MALTEKIQLAIVTKVNTWEASNESRNKLNVDQSTTGPQKWGVKMYTKHNEPDCSCSCQKKKKCMHKGRNRFLQGKYTAQHAKFKVHKFELN